MASYQPSTQQATLGEGTSESADVVSQLQTCLNQLTTQFFASVNYIHIRHPLSAPIDLQAASNLDNPNPSSGSASAKSSSNTNAAITTTTNGLNTSAPQARPPPPADPLINPVTGLRPDNEAEPKAVDEGHSAAPAAEFRAALRELAQDLVTKTRQIEELTRQLPVLDDGASGAAGMKREDEEGREKDKVGAEEQRQLDRIAELGEELKGLSEQVEQARVRRDRAKHRIEGMVQVWGKSRGIDG